MMTKKLKDCPFCGSSDITQVLTVGLRWIIGCNNCGVRTREYTSSLEAVTAWNRRPDDCDQVDSLNIEGVPF